MQTLIKYLLPDCLENENITFDPNREYTCTEWLNIGVRQQGRLAAKSVLNCDVSVEAIVSAIRVAISKDYKHDLEMIVNPYGEGRASFNVIEMIEKWQWSIIAYFG